MFILESRVSTFLGFLDFFSTENRQKLAFSDPFPPTSAYVIYECMVPKQLKGNNYQLEFLILTILQSGECAISYPRTIGHK